MDGIVNKSFEVATSLFATLVKPGTASVTAVDGAPEFAPGADWTTVATEDWTAAAAEGWTADSGLAVDRPVRADAGRPALSLGTAAAAPGTLGAMRVAPRGDVRARATFPAAGAGPVAAPATGELAAPELAKSELEESERAEPELAESERAESERAEPELAEFGDSASAEATPPKEKTAAPTPSAIARPPTRPMYVAALIAISPITCWQITYW